MFYGGSMPSLDNFQGRLRYAFNFLPRALTFINTYGLIIVDISLVVIFGLFILMSLLNKDMNLFCVRKVLGEAPPKPKQPAPAPAPQQQASQPVSAPAPQQQAQVQQPVPTPAPARVEQTPEQKVNGACANCGKVNNPEAKFCASCGSKLN